MPELKRATRLALLSAATGLTLFVSTSCETPLAEQECDQLLDHYTERLLREEQPEISNIELSRKQEEARKLARDAPRFEYHRCAELVSRHQFECAITATNIDSIERCLM